MPIIQRIIEGELDKRLAISPALMLDGARGVGKTTLAKTRAKSLLNLELPAIREIARFQPDDLLIGERPIFVDEWHLEPEILGAVRRAVDLDRRPGSFILAGSQPQSTPHSGVGRVSRLRVRTLLLQERGRFNAIVDFKELVRGQRPKAESVDISLKDYAEEITRSGFPGFMGLDVQDARQELLGYLDILLEADSADAGFEIRRPLLFRSWFKAFSSAVATTASFESIRKASGLDADSTPARKTTDSYFDFLSRLRIIDSVEAFSTANNPLKRVTSSPKHFLLDPGLAAAALGFTPDQLVLGHISQGNRMLFGQLFESLVALHLKVFSSISGHGLTHLREWDGRQEVDFVLESPEGEICLIEVKLSGATISDSRHLSSVEKALGSRVKSKLIITAGSTISTFRDGTVVVPLGAIRF